MAKNLKFSYNRLKDPQEMKSVYDDPGYSDIRRNLKAELNRLRREYEVDDGKKN